MSPDWQAGGYARELMRPLAKRTTLFQAWRKVRENGQHSLSNETRQEISQFDAIAAGRLDKIQNHLSHNRFEFRPQKGVTKRRPGKTPRPLVVAAIENRIVQRAILDILQGLPKICEILSIKTSIGGIKDRGREHAMALVRKSIQCGAVYFIRSDIQGFFTDIPRSIVSRYLATFILDDRFLDLFRRATDTNLANLKELGDDALLFPVSDRGVAQGSPLSPLIGNILLKDFDHDLNGRSVVCIRYIDDFLLLSTSPRSLGKAFRHAQQLLNDFGLHAYEPGVSEKAEAGKIQDGFDFLGCAVSPGLIQPARSARRKILSQVDSIIDDGRRAIASARSAKPNEVPKQRFAQTLDRIDRVVRGWGHAYAFCDGRQCFGSIDRSVDAKIDLFRSQTDALLSKATPETTRRVLGVHLLADTPVIPLPDWV